MVLKSRRRRWCRQRGASDQRWLSTVRSGSDVIIRLLGSRGPPCATASTHSTTIISVLGCRRGRNRSRRRMELMRLYILKRFSSRSSSTGQLGRMSNPGVGSWARRGSYIVASAKIAGRSLSLSRMVRGLLVLRVDNPQAALARLAWSSF